MLGKYLPERADVHTTGAAESVWFPLAIRKFTKIASRTLMAMRVKMTTQ